MCNLPPTELTDRPGSCTCHYGNSGVERSPNKSQHTNLTLENKKFPRRSCWDSNSQPFDYESGALTSKLSRPVDLKLSRLVSNLVFDTQSIT